jgi:hypothetical protein
VLKKDVSKFFNAIFLPCGVGVEEAIIAFLLD